MSDCKHGVPFYLDACPTCFPAIAEESYSAADKQFHSSVVDGLRRQGWERIDAEQEADKRLETLKTRRRELMEAQRG
jgi:hypothetical protein